MGLAVFTGQAAIAVRIIPLFGPPQNAASYLGYATNAINLIKIDGVLPAGERTSPTDARLLQLVAPEDLMTTTSLPFYRGVFYPVAPWNNERGGTVWWWVEVIANEGETVSLADISIVLSSSDPGNVLGKTVAFNGTGVAYSSTALGIQVDGSEINSGPADQQVKRVIVGIGSKSFPVSSATDVQIIRDFLNQFTNWRTTSMVTVKGITNTLVLSRAPPILKAIKVGDRFLVIAENNGDPTSYGLQASATLGNSAVWNFVGTIQAGQTNDMVLVSSPSLFVRYTPF